MWFLEEGCCNIIMNLWSETEVEFMLNKIKYYGEEFKELGNLWNLEV